MGCQKYQASELVWISSNVSWLFMFFRIVFSLILEHVADVHENSGVLSIRRWMLKKLSDIFFPHQ